MTLNLIGALATFLVLNVKLPTALAQGTNFTLLTITNPTPTWGGYFGFSVAGLGTDRILIGAYRNDTSESEAGAVYLFSTNGTLLNTITNPTPLPSEAFGWAVAAVGADRVLIGAPDGDAGAIGAGAAYLFSTNGALITAFVKPSPASDQQFGYSVAAFGTDRVLIGAFGDDTGAERAGAVYLFSTNGTLLTTYTNPTPAVQDGFGRSVAAVGTSRVLIGAYRDDTGGNDAGAAYLFSTNGTLLTTFTNPTPAASDYFGYSVAAVGSDRVLIGAYLDDKGALNTGAAYLFRTNGTLLTTFTNPAPASYDHFGISVAAVGTDRVLIGADGDSTGANSAGAAYLFSTSGALLTTFTNPTPAAYDSFGISVAALEGHDRVLIGAYSDGTGATGAGSAYLFSAAILQFAVFPTLTISNCSSAYNDHFGISVAAVGSDRVLIGACWDDTGATNAGAAHLFDIDGTLLTTFTNPTPANGDVFGFSVAAVGADGVLIGAFGDSTGASGAGAAYLFSTDGTLLTTFTNPTPADYDHFGISVAAVGTDRVLIGADEDDTGATSAGAAYLFNTNGTLLTTFTNPTPAADDHFGYSVAAVGNDRVIIGALRDDIGGGDAGAAYLFSTNGSLLTTFTNPAAATSGWFGCSVAAMGTDRVLIGAYPSSGGAAYLFTTNGALLATFTNPTPSAGDYFGISVAAVGTDRVLIGADHDDMGAADAGAAYLFSTNATLLSFFTKPTAVSGDYLGYCAAVVGTDWVLIGAYGADTSAVNAGAAYLFSIAAQTSSAPSLTIRLTPTNMVAVSWPSPSTGWTLQQNTNGVASVNWSNAPGAIQDDGTNKTLIIVPPAENRFYRLFKQ